MTRSLKCPACSEKITFPTGFPAKAPRFLCVCPACSARVKVKMRSFLGFTWPRSKEVKKHAPK